MQAFQETIADILGSLACDTADEAKTLIPSLANKMSDDALQAMLDEMSKLRESPRLQREDLPLANLLDRGSLWMNEG